MVRYSPRAVRALSYLNRHFNDIDIVVEDSANRNLWLYLIRSMLPPTIRLVNIVMLGGRDAVEAACKMDQSSTGRLKLYITDGDFDFLLGRKKRPLKYLYRLRAFNVENLLIEHGSILPLALEASPVLTENQVNSALDINSMCRAIEADMRKLFEIYALVFQFMPSLQTIGYSVHRLCAVYARGIRLDHVLVRRRAFKLYRELLAVYPASQLRQALHDIQARGARLPLSMVVSGKDYILPFAFNGCKRRLSYSGGAESFKVALAKTLHPAAEPFLARRLRNLTP